MDDQRVGDLDGEDEKAPWEYPAALAMAQYARREFLAAHETLRDAQDRLGTEVMAPIMIAWCDIALNVTGRNSKRPIHLRFFKPGPTGPQQATVDEVPPEMAWAGRVYASRASGDDDMLEALLLVPIGKESGEFEKYVYTLLDVTCVQVAIGLRTNPAFRRIHGTE